MAKEFSCRGTVQILGVNKCMKGNSAKNGQPYHFQEVSFGFVHSWTEGLRCGHCSIQGDSLNAVGCADGVRVGDMFDAYVTVNSFGQAKIGCLIARA